MLTSGSVLLHDNARPHTAARTPALLEHLNWELFDLPSYSPDLASSDYHLFTCLKNSLGVSQSFDNNEELMEGVKTWPSSQAAEFFDTGIKNVFPDTTSASISVVITLKSSSSMYVFEYNNIFLVIACCVNSSPEFTFRVTFVLL
jgi:hypothetical protein